MYIEMIKLEHEWYTIIALFVMHSNKKVCFQLRLGETKLICCFTGQATQKEGSVGRQKNKNKGQISPEK